MHVGAVSLEQRCGAGHVYSFDLLHQSKLHVHASCGVRIDAHIFRHQNTKVRRRYRHFVDARLQFSEPIDASRVGRCLTRHAGCRVERFHPRSRQDRVRRVSNVSRQGSIQYLRFRRAGEKAQCHQQHCANKLPELVFPAKNIRIANHRPSTHDAPPPPSDLIDPSAVAPRHFAG